jgi:gliding motility-associated lipoprotein GldH
MKRYPLILLLLISFVACDSNRVYEEYHDFNNKTWNLDSIPSFEFSIDNTDPKDLFVNLRNTISYDYQNLYLSYQLIDENGQELEGDLINISVFDEKTGKPFGSGNSIYEQQHKILENYRFPKNGNYVLKIAQYMREVDLKEVVSVGARVEKKD